MIDDLKYDAPLININDDALNRKDFSINLAKSIIDLKASHGFVYGLYGEWGCGKSTILNFVEHHIEKHNEYSDNKVIVFKFNPWMFANTENLVTVFLDQLRIRLNMPDVEGKLKKVSKTLGYLENGLNLGAIFIPQLGIISKVISKLKSTFGYATEQNKKDLNSIKEDIINALNEQEYKILVVIDDLDRLFDKEIQDFVRMIKAVCDFPKMIYLIACDSEKIAKALGNDGQSYLEKIVQCVFNVPNPEKHSLYTIFYMELDKIITPIHHIELFNKEGFDSIFLKTVASCLKTPRNIKSLLNAISVYYPPVRDKVNISDFVAIQTLRVFFPQVYSIVESNKSYFCSDEYSLEVAFDVKGAKLIYQNLFTSTLSQNSLANKILQSLFPKYLHYMNSESDYHFNEKKELMKYRKIFLADYFDSYFNLSFSNKNISLEEIKNILFKIDTLDGIKEKLTEFINKDIYSKALLEISSFLENEKESMPIEKIEVFLQALFDINDNIPEKDFGGSFTVSSRDLVIFVCMKLFLKIKNIEDSFELCKKICSQSMSISNVVHFTYLLTLKEYREKPSFSEEQKEELVKISYNKIKQFVAENTLHNKPSFLSTLYRWKQMSSNNDSDEIKQYLLSLKDNEQDLVRILISFEKIVISSTEGKIYQVPHKHFLDLLSQEELNQIIEKARLINQDTLDEKQKRVVTLFLDEADNPEKYKNRGWD